MKDILNSINSKLPPLIQGNLCAVILCSVHFFGWFIALAYKYYYLGYYDWDFALYAQATWSLTQGSLHPSLFGTNFLANHAHFFSFLVAPIYALFNHPFTLIALKILFLTVGAFVFYLLAKEALGWKIAIILMLLYITYPPNLFMLLYEFHFENLVIPFLFLLYYFFQKKRLCAFLITAFLISLIKENMPLVVVTFGLFALFFKDRNKLGWAVGPILLGGLIFYISMFKLIPAMRQAEQLAAANQYIGFYANLGNTPKSIIQTVLFQPIKVFSTIFTPYKLNFIRQLFGPVNIFPLLSPHILFLGLPIILQNLLSSAFQMQNITYHYAATIVPFLFLASLNTFKFLKERTRKFVYRISLLIISLSCVLNTLSYHQQLQHRLHWQDRLDPLRWQLINKIPDDAGTIATFEFLLPLVQRKELYSFHTVWQNYNHFSHQHPVVIPKSVSYAIFDFRDPWIWSDVKKNRSTIDNIQAFYLNNNWNVKAMFESLVLFERDEPNNIKLVKISDRSLSGSQQASNLLVDDRFYLESYEMNEKQTKKQNLMALTFYWKSIQDVPDHYLMILRLIKDGEIAATRMRSIGYAIFPTFKWKKNDYLKEHYWMLPPDLSPGQYKLEAKFYNKDRGKEALVTQATKKGDVEGDTFTLGVITIR